jgi:hypothetical protein
MSATRDFGPLDVTDFTLSAVLRTGIALRRAVRDCKTLETAAGPVSANRFRTIALDIRSALFTRDETRVWGD